MARSRVHAIMCMRGGSMLQKHVSARQPRGSLSRRRTRTPPRAARPPLLFSCHTRRARARLTAALYLQPSAVRIRSRAVRRRCGRQSSWCGASVGRAVAAASWFSGTFRLGHAAANGLANHSLPSVPPWAHLPSLACRHHHHMRQPPAPPSPRPRPKNHMKQQRRPPPPPHLPGERLQADAAEQHEAGEQVVIKKLARVAPDLRGER